MADINSSDNLELDDCLNQLSGEHSEVVDSVDSMIAELEFFGLHQHEAFLETLILYPERLRNKDTLPPGTFVDRLHHDEDFQASIAPSESPSWYYVDPNGQGYNQQDFQSHELQTENFDWDNVYEAPKGQWTFHTEQVARARPPKASTSTTRNTIIYRRFLRL